MHAVTVVPGKQGSVALSEMPEPPSEDGPILVRTQVVGICGTDLEMTTRATRETRPSAAVGRIGFLVQTPLGHILIIT